MTGFFIVGVVLLYQSIMTAFSHLNSKRSGSLMKKTAHIISHSHWDREWYLPFEKHCYYFIQLMNNLIEQFKKEGTGFQSFHLDGQTVLLEDYFAVHPENREMVKQLIEEKKLHIGPWYVLQDAFLTSSEANVRNLLIGMNDT
jgi:alpha-mannosidase